MGQNVPSNTILYHWIQQTLAGVTFSWAIISKLQSYQNVKTIVTTIAIAPLSVASKWRSRRHFLDLVETLGSQMRLTILVRGWDPVLDRARMGRDITFYWWRCWCYPEQRLLRDGDDFCDSCRLYLVWWRGIPVLPRNVMEPVGRIPCCRGVVIISVTGWGIKCLNMEILKETLSKDCTESSGYLQGSRCLR